jgi:ABC-type polysaccharide/polyol phosphate export permease
MIDGIIWGASIITVSHHIMPYLGVNPKFGVFIFVGNIAMWGLFQMLADTAVILADIAGHQDISYFLTLPIPQYLVFIRLALFNAYKSFVTPLPIFAVGKIILGDSLPFSEIAFGKLILCYILMNLFYGFFGLFLASISRDLPAIATIRTRYITPLWFLGGFQFSWKASLVALPTVAYINRFNPITYIFEGLRSTILNPQDFIPYWHCVGVLTVATILFGYFAVKNLERRLDCL